EGGGGNGEARRGADGRAGRGRRIRGAVYEEVTLAPSPGARSRKETSMHRLRLRRVLIAWPVGRAGTTGTARRCGRAAGNMNFAGGGRVVDGGGTGKNDGGKKLGGGGYGDEGLRRPAEVDRDGVVPSRLARVWRPAGSPVQADLGGEASSTGAVPGGQA